MLKRHIVAVHGIQEHDIEIFLRNTDYRSKKRVGERKKKKFGKWCGKLVIRMKEHDKKCRGGRLVLISDSDDNDILVEVVDDISDGIVKTEIVDDDDVQQPVKPVVSRKSSTYDVPARPQFSVPPLLSIEGQVVLISDSDDDNVSVENCDDISVVNANTEIVDDDDVQQPVQRVVSNKSLTFIVLPILQSSTQPLPLLNYSPVHARTALSSSSKDKDVENVVPMFGSVVPRTSYVFSLPYSFPPAHSPGPPAPLVSNDFTPRPSLFSCVAPFFSLSCLPGFSCVAPLSFQSSSAVPLPSVACPPGFPCVAAAPIPSVLVFLASLVLLLPPYPLCLVLLPPSLLSPLLLPPFLSVLF